MNIIEIVSWFVYIIIIISIMINIKPTIVPISIFFIYVYYSTYKYPDLCECIRFYKIPIILQHIIIFFYSILCTISYYIVYYFYNKYNYKYLIYFIIPIMYFSQLYTGHLIYGCKETFFLELYNLDKEDGELYNNLN